MPRIREYDPAESRIHIDWRDSLSCPDIVDVFMFADDASDDRPGVHADRDLEGFA